jgi:hypothetical protein
LIKAPVEIPGLFSCYDKAHMFKKQNGHVFACFSPPVMLATFIFELASMIYVLFRYKLNSRSRLVAALLLYLSIFQLAEYMVCQNTTVADIASRVGYVAITFLPVMGLHLMAAIVNSRKKIFLYISYLLAVMISAYFLVHPNSFQSYECTGNYVIFQIGKSQAFAYSTYYFGLILSTLIYGIIKYKKSKRQIQNNISWLIFGYLIFILPVAIISITHPDSRRAIPSVLCGFAVLFAVVLVVKIAPRVLKKS